MNLPSREECFALWDKYDVLEPVKAHVFRAEKIALFLAEKCIARGGKINLDFVEKTMLLHDIGKSEEIRAKFRNVDHCRLGHDILTAEGYPELARMALIHGLQYLVRHPEEKLTLEEKIIIYADLRGGMNRNWSIDDKMDYVLKKYGGLSKEEYDNCLGQRPIAHALEKELFKKLNIKQEDLRKLY